MKVFRPARQALAMCCIALICGTGCKKEKRVYDLLPPEAEDVTSQASLSVNIENTGGRTATEGSLKVIDNDLDTKFLIFTYAPNFYIQLQFLKPQHITSYTLTSANDAPGRDPKSWTISASNDATTWTTLDTRTGETFTDRQQTKNYEFTNANAYKYYRLNITANNGDTLFQLAEWRVTSIPLIN
jgi:hypothetical protein